MLRPMSKRNLATSLWFLMGWTLGLIVAFAAGLPSLLGPVLAVLLAAIVRWDPSGRLWPRARKTHSVAHGPHASAAAGDSAGKAIVNAAPASGRAGSRVIEPPIARHSSRDT